MFEVFICHATEDASAAAAVASRLARGTDIQTTLCDSGSAPRQTIVDVFDSGLSSDAILLLLSPGAVPPRKSRDIWKPLLDHVEHGRMPPVGKALLRDCDIPQVLTRNSFFHWKHDPAQALREIEAWVMQLASERDKPAFSPAALTRFSGRETELELMWSALVDNTGGVALMSPMPGSGKTALAQQFAHSAQDHFRSILWADCADRAPEFIAGDLARQLGARVEVFGREAFGFLGGIVSRHRLLVVLDDVRNPDVLAAVPAGFCSALVTTRSATIELPPHIGSLAIDPHRSVAPPPPDPGSAEGRLLHAMTVCRPNAFPLALSAEIAGLEARQAREICDALIAAGHADPVDAAGKSIRLPAHSQQPPDIAHRAKHAQVLLSVFRQPREVRAEFAAELENALDWSFANHWGAAVPLARHAFKFFNDERRPCEAALIFRRLRAAALERNDHAVAEQCDWELSWIEDSRGSIKSAAPPVEQLGFDFA
jgi:hypothetical protein